MPHKNKAYVCILVVAMAVTGTVGTSSVAKGHDWTGQCTVNFDNLFALTWVYANARATFASSTGITAGAPALCNSSHIACWTYRHRCSADYVNVDDDSGYGHFHLSFSNPGFDGSCGFADPGDGYGAGMRKKVGASCVTPDWKTEARVLNTHDLSQWIKIFMASSGSTTPKVFDMPRIRVGGTQPIQFWFRKTDGSWWYWSSLAPNNWNLSSYVNDVDMVRIKAAAGSGGGTVQIDDFDLLD